MMCRLSKIIIVVSNLTNSKRSYFILLTIFLYLQTFSETKTINSPIEKGILKDNIKVGVWEYYDEDTNELSLKVNYDDGTLLYIKKDTSNYVLFKNSEWITSRTDIPPRYIGSEKEFYSVLQKTTNYPSSALEMQTVGKLYLLFEVDTFGNATNLEIINSPGNGFDEVVKKGFSNVPNYWVPAVKDQKNYSSRFIIPFTFSMNMDGKEIKESVKSNTNKTEVIIPIAKKLEEIVITAVSVTRK